jgi:hypothetical protein
MRRSAVELNFLPGAHIQMGMVDQFENTFPQRLKPRPFKTYPNREITGIQQTKGGALRSV